MCVFFVFFLGGGRGGSVVIQWLSAGLETERPRIIASPPSLRCIPEQGTFILALVLVQPRNTRAEVTERLLTET